jgi:hypothetical protein
MVIVHCWYQTYDETAISLAPTTYLWDQELNHKSKLVYANGIAISPEEQPVPSNEIVNFTLYFEPLPQDCKQFWLMEETKEPHSFAAFDVRRNKEDIYWVEVECAPF